MPTMKDVHEATSDEDVYSRPRGPTPAKRKTSKPKSRKKPKIQSKQKNVTSFTIKEIDEAIAKLGEARKQALKQNSSTTSHSNQKSNPEKYHMLKRAKRNDSKQDSVDIDSSPVPPTIETGETEQSSQEINSTSPPSTTNNVNSSPGSASSSISSDNLDTSSDNPAVVPQKRKKKEKETKKIRVGYSSSDDSSQSESSDSGTSDGKRSDSDSTQSEGKRRDTAKIIKLRKQIDDLKAKRSKKFTGKSPMALNNTQRQALSSQAMPYGAITPCTGKDGAELESRDWKMWKTKFLALMNILGVQDSDMRQSHFEASAGNALLSILQTAPERSKSSKTGFDKTEKRIDAAFKNRSNKTALKQQLNSLKQLPNETNVGLVTRIKELACKIYDKEKSLRNQIATTLARAAKSEQMALLALTPNESGRIKSYDQQVKWATHVDAVSAVRDDNAGSILAVNSAPQDYRHGNAPVSRSAQAKPRFSNENRRFYSTNSSYHEPYNNSNSSSTNMNRCTRCLSSNHRSDNCQFAAQKCYYCQGMGHTRVACRKRIRDAEMSQATSGKAGSHNQQVSEQTLPKVNNAMHL